MANPVTNENPKTHARIGMYKKMNRVIEKDQLGYLADKTELVNDLAWIAHDLFSDEDYTKENAAEAIIKVINRQLSYVSKIR